MGATRGRRGPWLLGTLLVAAGLGLAVPSPAGACGTATTVTLTSSENPTAYGDQLILTATVIPASGTAVPSGSVTFEDGSSSLGTVSVGATGQAALVCSGLAAGTHQLTADYAGSATFAASVSSVLEQDVTVQGSTTLLLPTVDPATYGETLLFVVSVLPAAGGGVPTGRVSLLDGGTAVGSASLVGGAAAVVVTSLDVGTHAIAATYAGDGNFSPSSSISLSEQVAPASTATGLTVSPTSAATGQTVTLTAAVSSAGGVPGGTVAFSDGGTSLGTATLSGGTATLTTCFGQSGTQKLTAAYSGTGNFAASGSGVVTLPVTPGRRCSTGCAKLTTSAGRARGLTLTAYLQDQPGETALLTASSPVAPQLVTVGAAPASVDAGQSVTLTSVVFGSGTAPFPSGTVDFLEGSTLLGAAATAEVGATADALASLRVALTAGSYPSITAAYHPDAAAQAFYAAATSASTAAVTVERVAASTTLSVATSLNPSPAGRPVIVTATVNHPSSSLTPTGTITFTVNGTGRTAVALDSLGQASLTLSSLAPGTQSIAASYSGDANFSSSSGSSAQSVGGGATPTATPTAAPTGTPKPGGSSKPGGASTPPSPATARSTGAAAPVIVPPVTASPPSRPSGVSGSAPTNPDQFDTSEVPPIDAISLVSGIHMGNAPQIIVFLIVFNALVLGAIAVASRRGRRLTRRTLEYAGPSPDQTPSSAR
ncbi:MAG: Ig-like domain-containing protein [Candidatus Dormibacteria bacterium]